MEGTICSEQGSGPSTHICERGHKPYEYLSEKKMGKNKIKSNRQN